MALMIPLNMLGAPVCLVSCANNTSSSSSSGSGSSAGGSSGGGVSYVGAVKVFGNSNYGKGGDFKGEFPLYLGKFQNVKSGAIDYLFCADVGGWKVITRLTNPQYDGFYYHPNTTWTNQLKFLDGRLATEEMVVDQPKLGDHEFYSKYGF